MIDFSFSDEERMVRDSVRSFIQKEVMPYENVLIRRDIAGESPHLTQEELKGLQLKAKDAGFWGIDTPEEYGGAGLSPVMQALIWEEIGKSFVRFKFGGSAMNVLFLLNDEQKREYLMPTLAGERIGCFALSEPGVGSDARGIKATAVRDGDEWVVNGEKTWITNGPEADYTILFARTPDHGDPEGITAFMVDRDMGWTSTPIPMMGAHDPASLHFDNVRVPNRNMVGEINQGFRLAMKFIYKNRGWHISSRNVGAAERLLKMALDYAEDRSTFGRKIADRENIQWMISQSEVEIRAAKMMVWNCAWQAGQDLDYRHSACVAKYHCAQMANRVVDNVMQIHGGIGYAKELPIERWYRDLRIERIYEGTDEMNLAWIFRNLRKGNAEVGQLN